MNANRHAQARRVSVELAVDDAQLTMSIADDGRGMTSDRREPSLGVGIPGMHARAQQLSGELEIASDACGTRVSAWLPLA
jgi:signal transduction histidine kinase